MRTFIGMEINRITGAIVDAAYRIHEEAFRADLIIENCVIVEIKSVDRIAPVHKKQVLTYLKLSGVKVGLLINFGGEFLKGNIERLVMPGAPTLPEQIP
jgi:iron complex transport system substrate-binding protein